MEKIEYERLNDRERFYWWNIGRRMILEEALDRAIGQRSNLRAVLDVGCGAGGNILFLKKFGRVSGVDVSNEALRFSSTKGFESLVKGSADALPIEDGAHDIVALLDVIEHLDNDEKALREAFRVLRQGGVLLLTVPAHPFLWSRHDVAMHHRRRYTSASLRERIIGAGFHVEQMTHFVIPAIPFLLVREFPRRLRRRLAKRDSEKIDTYDVILPRIFNTLLIWWLAIERMVIRFIPIPFGSSLLVVARKRARD